MEDNQENYIPVALAGRVYVKVVKDVVIKEGDLLQASPSQRGLASPVGTLFHGSIIGKALESSQGDKDKILIQVFLG